MPIYGKNPKAVSKLSPEQYRVTQTNRTERAFSKEYWDSLSALHSSRPTGERWQFAGLRLAGDA
jgi:hypothetical protein